MNAVTEQTPVQKFNTFMARLKPQVALAIPTHLNADRMARLALTEFSKNDALQKCDFNSIAGSIMTAAQMGLEPGVNGAGYLIPYKGRCTFVPGWKGLVDLVNRSGRATVYTGVIFSDQKYVFKDGSTRDLQILNETDLDDPNEITHVYAIGWVKDSQMPVIELWRMSKIVKHRDKYNKVGGRHYSYENMEMYARKVPLLQVLKYMPCSIEVQNAIALSDAAEAGHQASIVEGIVITDPDDQTAAAAPPDTYPEDQFAKDLPGWQKIIAGGKKTADQAIAAMESKHPLTDEQKAKIRAVSAGPPKVTYAMVAEKLNKADAIDVLDLAADMIGEVADPAHRADLTGIYNKRKEELSAQ